MIVEGYNENGRVLRREGVKRIYQLQEGEDWYIFLDMLVIVHPDKPPKIVHADGRQEVLRQP